MESARRNFLLLLLVSSSLLLFVAPTPARAQTPIQHAPILIASDPDFLNPLNGVSAGDGSPQFPFIIENWNITTNTSTGIHIRNTQSFFVIRNVFIHPANFTANSSGILFDNVVNGRIENARIANFEFGITVYGSQNTIATNTVWNSTNGIALTGNNDIISGNQLYNNTRFGLWLMAGSSANTIRGNNASSNGNGVCEAIVNPCDGEGFVIIGSSNNVFENNTAFRNAYFGFRTILGSQNNVYRNNQISNNQFGLIFSESSGNQAFSNNVTNNDLGIGLEVMNTDNNVTMNRVTSNGVGIYVTDSSRNMIYNNYLQNPNNAIDDSALNAWNTTKTFRTNILGGPFQGGNFYSNYLSQSDLNGDGIGDTPYMIQDGPSGPKNKDLLPLVQNQPTVVHDIAVGSLTVHPVSARSGTVISVQAPVLNQGTVSESFIVSLSYNRTIIDSSAVNVANLPAWSGTSVSTSWDTVNIMSGAYALTANASIVTGETYKTNNISPPVTITIARNIPPSAQFSTSPSSTVAGSPVNFDASGSFDPDGSIASYSWDFGDGTTGNSPTPYHAYQKAGDYTVSLRVTDNEGAVSSFYSKTLTVRSNVPSAPISFQVTATSGKATLTWSPPNASGGSPITSYKIYRGTSPSQLNLLTTVGNQTSYLDETVSNGQTFYYKVTALNAAGIEGPPSSQEDVLVPNSGTGPGSGAGNLPSGTQLWPVVAIASIAAFLLGVLVIRRLRMTRPKTA